MSRGQPSRQGAKIRPRAVTDIERHAAYLDGNATSEVTRRFRLAVMEVVARIAEMPHAGSPREVRNPRMDGLRMTVVPGFRNYLLFYLTPEGAPEVIRLLHGAQDIDALIDDEE